jgi:AcrR family transcriptional regulator
MVRAGLSTPSVVDAALAVIDEQGPGALTLAAVAARTGVAAPSLYKHVGGLAELRTLVGLRVIEDMTGRFRAAVLGRSGDDAVVALMQAYRDYVRERPARYALMPLDPLHQPELAEAATAMLDVTLAALRDYDLTPASAIHVTRCIRAAAHGFASLEAGGGFGFPQDVDASYAQLIRMVLTGLGRGPGMPTTEETP